MIKCISTFCILSVRSCLLLILLCEHVYQQKLLFFVAGFFFANRPLVLLIPLGLHFMQIEAKVFMLWMWCPSLTLLYRLVSCSGVKFSAEEERTVIDLQAQFGNKWARIATYLSGRTDNDVKNFWSSRQKRLARILQTSAPSSSKSQKNTKEVKVHAFHDVPLEVRLSFSL